jgi:hypothetical protein
MNFSHFFVLLITLIEITLLIGIPYLLIRYIIRLNKKNSQKIQFENNLGSTSRIYPIEINDKNFEELEYLQFKQQQPQIRKNRFWRKFIFFYLVFNLIAYSVFLLKFHPKIDNIEKDGLNITKIYDYIFIPDYYVLERCSNCELKESENFYPFHEFSFSFGSGGYDSYFHNYYRNSTKGFVGIFGFYGHTEFFFYVIVPILIYLLSIIYKKYVR